MNANLKLCTCTGPRPFGGTSKPTQVVDGVHPAGLEPAGLLIRSHEKNKHRTAWTRIHNHLQNEPSTGLQETAPLYTVKRYLEIQLGVSA